MTLNKCHIIIIKVNYVVTIQILDSMILFEINNYLNKNIIDDVIDKK